MPKKNLLPSFLAACALLASVSVMAQTVTDVPLSDVAVKTKPAAQSAVQEAVSEAAKKIPTAEEIAAERARLERMRAALAAERAALEQYKADLVKRQQEAAAAAAKAKAEADAKAAAAAKSGIQENLDNVVRRLLGKNLCKSLISAGTDVLVDILGIDDTAVAESHTILLLVEIRLVHRDDAVRGNRLLIEILGYDVTVYKVLGNNLRNMLNRHVSVESGFRINDNDRAESAEAVAAGAYDANVVLETVLLDFVVKCNDDVFTVGGSTAGTAAHKDMMLVVLALCIHLGDLGFALAAHRNDAFLLRLNLVKFRNGYHLLPPVTRILQGSHPACRQSTCRKPRR